MQPSSDGRPGQTQPGRNDHNISSPAAASTSSRANIQPPGSTDQEREAFMTLLSARDTVLESARETVSSRLYPHSLPGLTYGMISKAKRSPSFWRAYRAQEDQMTQLEDLALCPKSDTLNRPQGTSSKTLASHTGLQSTAPAEASDAKGAYPLQQQTPPPPKPERSLATHFGIKQTATGMNTLGMNTELVPAHNSAFAPRTNSEASRRGRAAPHGRQPLSAAPGASLRGASLDSTGERGRGRGRGSGSGHGDSLTAHPYHGGGREHRRGRVNESVCGDSPPTAPDQRGGRGSVGGWDSESASYNAGRNPKIPENFSRWVNYANAPLRHFVNHDGMRVCVEKLDCTLYGGIPGRIDLGLCKSTFTKNERCPLDWTVCPLRHWFFEYQEKQWVNKEYIRELEAWWQGPFEPPDREWSRYQGRPRQLLNDMWYIPSPLEDDSSVVNA